MRELNQNTSQVIDRVRRGETIEVTDRGRPVARLVPVIRGTAALDQLVAEGRAIPPAADGPLPMPPLPGAPSVNATDELTAMRDEERR
ncbi:type II toxin-antitoxin system Phd/YefM family antitoxin [Frankia gtarii]|uniref:type II toxin-antitoxin system Phd/YefM family antitoxin n=1 Tax=Frankia gtarii TaxID=2950102 RepID=UPI0021BF5A1F|nr:type II toxin-antitoxin system prevent-host-death family antitoxin [Frankia gtarii]